MNYNQLVASRMKQQREISKLTVSAVADHLNTQKSTISLLENGKQQINVEHLKTYSLLLNIPITTFLPEIKLNIEEDIVKNEADTKLYESLKTAIDCMKTFLGRNLKL